jgi:valyl-tRNA synthetase
MTTLAPQYDPSAIEADTYKRWLDAGVFGTTPEPDRIPYVIVIPPPNVTAVLHSGHGLNNTLQDVLIRFQRMRGRDALWLPGTDHAGIATQNVVERMLDEEGKTRQDLGRDAFVERVWQHVHKTGGTILEQLKAIGCSCDWSRTRFTLDAAYSLAVRKVFVDLYKDDKIYRGHRVIHWCPRCRTSLSDEEAEFRDRDDHLYYIKYRVHGGHEAPDGVDSTAGDFVTVATTRPETMFGDVCLVFHPEDDRFQKYEGATVAIPLSGERIPIRTSTVVEQDFGTGMLKVTPAHDANDFDIAESLGGFERPVTMAEDATMSAMNRVPSELHGLDRFAARKKILELLEVQGQLAKVEPYSHSVRHCYRCKTIVEPRLSDQWFVKMRPLAEPALRAYREGKLRFVPERWGKVYEHWLTQIRDWNISRQLWWGHRIPAWFCNDCDHITVSMDEPQACEQCGGELRQEEDVLDTWFSSWLWPFATFGWPERTPDLERFYPGHTLVTGPDIIFFWVARMVMAGYYFMGDTPFETVYMNGIVRDPQHRAFSKSLGNGIDPMDVIELFGADAYRFTIVAAAAAGTDTIMDRNDLDGTFAAGRNFANKIWNIGRLILSNIGDAATATDQIDPAQLELADRWILSRCQRTIGAVTEALDRFRLNDAATEIYHFMWNDLADWYVEQVKPRLYGNMEGGDTARRVLCYVFETALKLLHPTMPFITEQMWDNMPGERESLLAGSTWPQPNAKFVDEEAEDQFARVQALVSAVRTIRAEYHVEPSKEIRANVQPASTAAFEAFNAEQHTVERLAKIGELLMDGDDSGDIGAHQVLPDGSSVFVPLGDAIDVAKECARLGKELTRLDTQLTGVFRKLENAQFISRAPAEVVEREREKERSWQEQREALAAKLRILGC